MTNAERIADMPPIMMAVIIFHWQMVSLSLGIQDRFNEMLDYIEIKNWLESTDGTLIRNLLSDSWCAEGAVDFTPWKIEPNEEEQSDAQI